jgi:GT2 family glycosyltransferase/glycosyltransferase involved in cell wall biosynthesis
MQHLSPFETDRQEADRDVAGAGGSVPRAQAVALVNRLIAQDEQLHELAHEAVTLRRHLAQGAAQAPAGGQGFDVPRTRYEWKLADDQQARPDGMWLYDIRVDDPVVLAGREGVAFFRRFDLLGNTPDYAGVLEACNEIAPHVADAPDVSIVIPVYGQLPYTLNAIDALLRHRARAALEIIVVDDGSPDNTPEILPGLTGIVYHAQENAGFIAACNQGAALARGRFVVMLNNDTRVVEGWLDALVDSFTRWPRAGLVGAKLHYADGSLQEAGGIIWRDGRAWNYGRNDDPNRPQYSHARQVDYISGCSIALPAALWRALGGFDEFFSPAYCEDVDLALRVRAAGYEVWYQPQARVVHYEGKTSGTDTGGGTKAYQIVNEKKILLRWRETLAAHRFYGVDPYFERERGAKKRFLVIDLTSPATDQDAGSVQTFLALEVIIALGYKAYFVPNDNWLFMPRYTTALQAMGVECGYAPYDLGIENYLRRYGWLFDVVMVYRAGVMESVLPYLRTHAPQAPVIFHLADLHYLRLERGAELADDDEQRDAAALMKTRELAMIEAADCTISHSEVEAAILEAEVPGCPVAVWPLMTPRVGAGNGFAARRDIGFLGGYRHPPNIDAMVHFVAEIFPALRLAIPGVRLVIAGSFPPEEILGLAAEDIVVRGQVDDLADFFEDIRVFVCPLRVGAGAKGKLVTAMAHGVPIVTTPIGAEGLNMTDGESALIADGVPGFVAATQRLYGDEALWQRLSAAGLAKIDTEFSTGLGCSVLAAAVETAFAQKLGVYV